MAVTFTVTSSQSSVWQPYTRHAQPRLVDEVPVPQQSERHVTGPLFNWWCHHWAYRLRISANDRRTIDPGYTRGLCVYSAALGRSPDCGLSACTPRSRRHRGLPSRRTSPGDSADVTTCTKRDVHHRAEEQPLSCLCVLFAKYDHGQVQWGT